MIWFEYGMQLAGEKHPVYCGLPGSGIIFDITLLSIAVFKVTTHRGHCLMLFLILTHIEGLKPYVPEEWFSIGLKG